MRSDRPLPSGARQTDTVRAELNRLLAKFPDPDEGLDPVERLERALADLKIDAERLLADADADRQERALMHASIKNLLVWANHIDMQALLTDLAASAAILKTHGMPKRPSLDAFLREETKPPSLWQRIRAGVARQASRGFGRG